MGSSDSVIVRLGVEGLSELDAGMKAGAAAVKDAVGQMSFVFEEAGKVAEDSFGRTIPDSIDKTVTAAAQTTEAWRTVALATEQYQDALAAVKAAQDTLATGEGIHEDNLDRMAAALQNAANAHDKLAEAQAEVNKTNTELGESIGGLARGIQNFSSVGNYLESNLGVPLNELKEKFVAVAEAEEGSIEGLLAYGAAVIAVGAAVLELGEKFADETRSMDSLSQRFQISTELYQLMSIEAERLAVDQGTLTFGMRMLTTELARAKEVGGATAQKMRDLGIEGQTSSQALQTLTNRLADSSTAADTASKLTVALGQRGAMLTVVLKDLAKQQQASGGTLDDLMEKYEASGTMIDRLGFQIGEAARGPMVELHEQWLAIANMLGERFAPIAAQVADLLVQLIDPIRGVIGAVQMLFDVLKLPVLGLMELAMAMQYVTGDSARAKAEMHGLIDSIKDDWSNASQWFVDKKIKPEVGKDDKVGKGSFLEVDKNELGQIKKDLESKLAMVTGGHDAELAETAKFYREKLAIVTDQQKMLQDAYDDGIAKGLSKENAGQLAIMKAIQERGDELYKIRKDLEAAERPLAAERKAASEAEVEGEKSLALQRIALAEQTAKEMRAAGIISADEELRQLLSLEDRKLEIEKKAIEAKKTLAIQSASELGKSPAADVKKLDTAEEEATGKTAAAKQALNAKAVEEKKKLDEAMARAEIEGAEKITQAQVAADRAATKQRFELHQIEIAEETSQLLAENDRAFEGKKTSMTAELALLKAQGPAKAAEAQKLADSIKELEIKNATDVAAIKAEGNKKALEDAKKDLDQEVAFAKEAADIKLEDAKRTDDTALKVHKITLSEWAHADNAAIEVWYRERLSALSRELTFAEATYGKESREYRKVVDEMSKLDQQRVKQIEANNLKVSLSFQQNYDKITAKINSSLTSALQGHESFTKALIGMYDNMAARVIEALLRMAEQEIASLILHKVIGHQEVDVEAKKTAANAFHSVMASVPFPANVILAPLAAAGAFAAVEAFGSFEKGGIQPTDGMAMLHKNEMVLPANISSMMQGMAKGEAGGSTQSLHFHYHGNDPRQDMPNAEREFGSMVKRAARKGLINVANLAR